MGQFVASLMAGDTSVPSIRIQAGASIETDVEWKDASGAARNMSGATVTLKVLQMPGRKVVYQATLSPPTTLAIPAAVTAGWPTRSRYHAEVWETAGDGTVQVGHILIEVGD